MSARTLALVAALLCVAPTALAQQVPTNPTPAGSAGADVWLMGMNLTAPPVVDVQTSSVVTVWNHGSSASAVTVTWSYSDGPVDPRPPSGAFNSKNLIVQPGIWANFTLPFTPTAERKGNQTIIATTSWSSGSQGTTSTNVSRQTVFVSDPKLTVSVDPTLGTEAPIGGWVLVRYFVHNDGNANETPNVSLSEDPNFETLLMKNFTLVPPGTSASGALLVRPRTNLTTLHLASILYANSSVRATLVATTPLPAANASDTAVLRDYRVVVDPIPALHQVIPATERHIPVRIANRGNTTDAYRIDFAVAPNGTWNATLALNASNANLSVPNGTPYYVGLAPNETAVLDLVVAANVSLPPAPATAFLNVTSANGALLPALERDGRYRGGVATTLVPATPDLDLAEVEGDLDLYPGDPQRYEFSIANAGLVASANATLRLALQDSTHVVKNATFTIAPVPPGGTVTQTWSISTETLRGDYRLLASLDPNATDRDPTIENNLLEVKVHARSPSIRVLAPDEVAVHPGAQLVLTAGNASLRVANDGDRAETVSARVVAPDAPWIETEWTVEVPSHVSVPLPLDLPIPESVGVEAADARVLAMIVGHPSYTASEGFDVRVEPLGPPTVRIVETPSGVVGRPSELRIHATDAIRVLDAHVRVVFSNGEGDYVRLDPDNATPDEFAGTYVPRVSGKLALEYVVTGEGTPRRAASTGALPWDVASSGYDGFVPVGFAEGGAVGDLGISFREKEPNTTARLYVDLGSGPQLVSPPYAVRISGWKDGPHTIQLSATSIAGEPWSKEFHVVYDSRPPTLGTPQISTRDTGEIVLSVAAERASKVSAKFVAGDHPVQVQLAPSSGGTFAASVAPPAGWSSIVLTAVSDTGSEASVSIEKPPASRTVPSLALPAMGLALVATALAARRRR